MEILESDDIESSQESEQSSQRSQSETNTDSPEMTRIKDESTLLPLGYLKEFRKSIYCGGCISMQRRKIQRSLNPTKKISQKNMIGCNLLNLHR